MNEMQIIEQTILKYTGMRPCEIKSIHCENIDFSERVIRTSIVKNHRNTDKRDKDGRVQGAS